MSETEKYPPSPLETAGTFLAVSICPSQIIFSPSLENFRDHASLIFLARKINSGLAKAPGIRFLTSRRRAPAEKLLKRNFSSCGFDFLLDFLGFRFLYSFFKH
jgi:hypothetical protein